MKVSKTEREQQLAQLHKWLKPGDTVYTILEHSSRSGMSRDIRVVLLKCQENGEAYTLHPNHAVSVVLGLPRGKREGVKIQGCGMDMGFEIVYQLGGGHVAQRHPGTAWRAQRRAGQQWWLCPQAPLAVMNPRTTLLLIYWVAKFYGLGVAL